MESKSKIFERANAQLSFMQKQILVDSDNDISNKRVLSSIWSNYFSMGYYLGVVPFKPEFNYESSLWTIKTCKFQQAICISLWMCVGFYLGTTSLSSIVDASRSGAQLTAKSYFSALTNILNPTHLIMVFIVLKNHKQEMEEILNHTIRLKYISSDTLKHCMWYMKLLFSIQAIFNCAPCFFNSLEGNSFVGPKEVFDGYISGGRYRFFMDPSFVEYTTGNIFLALLEFALRFCTSNLFWIESALFLGPLPITFWLSVKDLETFTDYKLWSVQEIKEHYGAVKSYSTLLNNLWSVTTLSWLVSSVFTAMMYLNVLLGSRDPGNVMLMTVWMLSISVHMILSGETHRKMECFRVQLINENNYNRFYNQDKLILRQMIKELSDGPVGIASTGLYRLTYGFVAQVALDLLQLLVAVLTVFIVSFEKSVTMP